MKIRRASPLLLLLVSPALISAQQYLDVNNAGQEAAALVDTGAAAAKPAPTKGYVGTEDAPVDGRDGKPHAGPFVDWDSTAKAAAAAEAEANGGSGAAATDKSKQTESAAQRAVKKTIDRYVKFGEQMPEKNDGVMNDEDRPIAKKGTTGTEGGISEKTRNGGVGGGNGAAPVEPKSPAMAAVAAARNVEVVDAAGAPQAAVVAGKSGAGGVLDSAVSGKPAEGDVKKDTYGSDGSGLTKPVDLPDTPYPNEPKPPRKGPPVDSGDRSKWLVASMPDTEGKTNLNPPKSNFVNSGGNKGSSSVADKAAAAANAVTTGHEDHETWHELFHSFVLSFAMIIFSEIGDKTFIVAALMAMRHPRWLVFSAAFSALIAMTVLSAVLGHAFPTLLPKRLTTLAAALLFFVFGLKSLHEGLNMSRDAGIGEEMREVEAELEEKEQETRARRSEANGGNDSDSDSDPYSLEGGRRIGAPGNFAPKINRPGLLGHRGIHRKNSSKKVPGANGGGIAGLTNLFSLLLSPAWVQTFIMTFLGEWGDRSQIATIAMAAGQDYWWVTLGAVVGHACCTGLAVVGGRALAGRVSMRVVTIGGAVAFLFFGVIYLYECIMD